MSTAPCAVPHHADNANELSYNAMALSARRLHSVRTWLLALVLAALLPGVIGAAALLWFQLHESRQQVEETTFQTTRALGQAVDLLLLQVQAAAQGLAVSDALARDDLASFHAQAREMIRRTSLGEAVVLRNRAGVELVNTVLDFGVPNPAPPAPERVAEVFEIGRPVVHDLLLFGPVTHGPIMSVDVPVFRQGEVVYALGIAVPPSEFDKILLQQGLPPTWLGGVIDGSGRYVARIHALNAAVGMPASTELLSLVDARLEGAGRVRTADGRVVQAFHSRSPTTGWSVVIGIPADELNRLFVQSLVLLAAGIAGLVITGLLLARWIARYIAQSIQALSKTASELGSGQVLTPPAVGIREAAEVASAMATASRLLREYASSLREADRRKDQFIAVLAHELRNPLAPMRNAVEILAREGGGTNTRIDRVTAVLARQVAHMARLVDDLLDTSRIARGNLSLRKQACDLAAITAQTADDYGPSLEAMGGRLKVQKLESPLPVLGDPVRLAQMVGNLLTNAGKFNSQGGTIEISAEADQKAGMALVHVADSGIGIAPEDLTDLFEPFVQVGQHPERAQGGLGLGLALTRGLARLHGGDASAQSDGVGHGATFTLSIPLIPKDQSQPPPSPEDAPVLDP